MDVLSWLLETEPFQEKVLLAKTSQTNTLTPYLIGAQDVH